MAAFGHNKARVELNFFDYSDSKRYYSKPNLVKYEKNNKPQYDLMGAVHCDHHEDVNKKVPDGQTQSILLALDPFNLLYESNMGTGGLMD